MTKLLLPLFICAILAAELGSSRAQTLDSISRLMQDKSASHVPFSLHAMVGDIIYRASYERSRPQPLLVSVSLKSPAPLECMNYKDFQFDLRNQAGVLIPNSPQTMDAGGQPLPPIVRVMPRAVPGMERPPCVYGTQLDARFNFRLDELYPNLVPGAYTLAITFRSRDGSVPVTTLPAVKFQIR